MPCKLTISDAAFLATLWMLVLAPISEIYADPLWKQLVPRKKIAADLDAEYWLGEEHGPWLILASSFSGENAEQQAHDLVFEFRSKYNIPAYQYAMTFQLDDENIGRGVDHYGGKIKRRYRRGSEVQEYAVLVGGFESINNEKAQALLDRVKHMKPATLTKVAPDESAQSLASLRRVQEYMRDKTGIDSEKGPMRHAFLTRNPLLPKEYFVPKGVEDDVAEWNEGIEYSLMKCKGKYSIRVATFRGRVDLQGAKGAKAESTSDKPSNALALAAEKAHLLTVALREKGWPAFEFHDRHESYVTVGAFDNGRTSPDGEIVIDDRNAEIIIKTFGATSPNNVFNVPATRDKMLEQQKKQEFLQQLSANNLGQVAEGFYPKRFVGLPFDIYPEPVAVPRRSVSAAYARH